MSERAEIIESAGGLVKEHFPAVQAIYLFGAYATDSEWSGSDVDVALLLPHEVAAAASSLYLNPLHTALQEHFAKEVDLINLRRVNTVFQFEILASGRRIDCADGQAADEFEMLVISFYQKLNEERAEIVEQGLRTGRFYDV